MTVTQHQRSNFVTAIHDSFIKVLTQLTTRVTSSFTLLQDSIEIFFYVGYVIGNNVEVFMIALIEQSVRVDMEVIERFLLVSTQMTDLRQMREEDRSKRRSDESSVGRLCSERTIVDKCVGSCFVGCASPRINLRS